MAWHVLRFQTPRRKAGVQPQPHGSHTVWARLSLRRMFFDMSAQGAVYHSGFQKPATQSTQQAGLSKAGSPSLLCKFLQIIAHSFLPFFLFESLVGRLRQEPLIGQPQSCAHSPCCWGRGVRGSFPLCLNFWFLWWEVGSASHQNAHCGDFPNIGSGFPC